MSVGISLQALTDVQQAQVKEALLSNKPIKFVVDKKLINNLTGTNHLTVTYKSNLPQEERIVSSYSIAVIKMALKESGMSHAVITSTIRDPYEQANLMFKFSKSNIDAQYKLYGPAGDKVLDIFAANQSRPKN